MLVRVIRNWTSPDLMRQTPAASGCWEGIQFTYDPVDECDAVIVLNHVVEPASVRCPPDNIWALMQEPYVAGVFDWMLEGHKQYTHVFTHHPCHGTKSEKYIRCQPALPWHVNKSYDELKVQSVPDKQKELSWITSNLTVFPGHRTRMDFLAHLQSCAFPIDLYGRGISYIDDKWDGLAPYRYSFAIENNSGPDYWTEKVADCFLSWTVPIYYGCTNLEDYFPAGSFIRIDINRPKEALEIVEAAVSSDDWVARLPALTEARKLVLEKYQFFPQMRSLLEQYYVDSPAESLLLQPYRQKHRLFRKIWQWLSRLTGAA